MKQPMLTPTVGETVQCVVDSLTEVIMPEMHSQKLRSSMASTLHLLRYVKCRVADEGQMLYDEIRYLRGLFAEIIACAAQYPEAAALVERIRATLDAPRDPDIYPTLDAVGREVAAMRQHVCDAIVLVQAHDDAAASALRDSLNRYVGWQILQDEKLIASAFRGHGPRR